LIECSECKNQVAKDATKCPKCGHLTISGIRRNVLLFGEGCSTLSIGLILYIAYDIQNSGAGTDSASLDTLFIILLTICAFMGVALMYYSRFGNMDRYK
jgi:NAD-dependent SIR2 family protein deacetylase